MKPEDVTYKQISRMLASIAKDAGHPCSYPYMTGTAASMIKSLLVGGVETRAEKQRILKIIGRQSPVEASST